MKPTATLHPMAGAAARAMRLASPARAAAALVAMTLLALASSPARAWEEGDDWSFRNRHVRGFDTWVDGRLVDAQIRVDGGPAPLYTAPGRLDRHYLQAFAGRNYSVVLHNNTGRRVAVLLAVDGLNAVNGEISSLRSSEPMYVLGPWEQATIRGWRTSLDEIRRFVFVDEQRSYAERTGQANSDMGWIRVLAFREQIPWWQSRRDDWGRVRSNYRGDNPGPLPPVPQVSPVPPSSELDSKDEAVPPTSRQAVPEASGKALAPEAQDNLARGEEGRGFPGTGWGDRRQDHVDRVQFTPERVAADQLIFRYEYASGLRALGIFPLERSWRGRLDERDGEMGFAKPPQR